jgi:hypothetical protein
MKRMCQLPRNGWRATSIARKYIKRITARTLRRDARRRVGEDKENALIRPHYFGHYW